MQRRSRARTVWTVLAILVMPVGLTGCLGVYSVLYFDRRESISLHAGDAVAANKVAQMIDPWPAEARDRNIPGNGERQQKAVERYRTGNVKKLHTETSAPVFQPLLFGTAPGGSPAAP